MEEQYSPQLVIKKLLMQTDNMYGHARNGDWELLEKTDRIRNQLISSAVRSGIELSPSAEQLSYLREKQNTIEALATQERERISSSFGRSRKNIDQCSYYLRNESQPTNRPDLHNRSL